MISIYLQLSSHVHKANFHSIAGTNNNREELHIPQLLLTVIAHILQSKSPMLTVSAHQPKSHFSFATLQTPNLWPLKALYAPIFFMSNLLLLLIQLVNGACISLSASKYCPELKDYSIRSYAQVETVEQFDKYLEAEAAYNYGQECGGWRSAAGSNLKYSKSTACAVAVFLSSRPPPVPNQEQCNLNSPPPPLLCKSSVRLTFDDIEAKLNQVTEY